MQKIKVFLVFELVLIGNIMLAQTDLPLLNTQTKAGFRGIAVVTDSIVWASGTAGTVLKTLDGGTTWQTYQVAGADSLQFRDIAAFNDIVAYIVSAGLPANIYKTTDGGNTWILQYNSNRKGMFFDGFDFWNEKEGVAYSDPIGNKWLLAKTTDGENWIELPPLKLPPMLDGEAGFAASGTGIQVIGNDIWIASGGTQSKVYHTNNKGKSWQVRSTPMATGKGKGIFSMHFKDELNGVIVGGSYIDSMETEGNIAITTDGGKTWNVPKGAPPNGYRSCVCYAQNKWVATGRTGVDISHSKGKDWEPFSKQGFYTCAFSKNYLWLSGKNGKIAKFPISKL